MKFLQLVAWILPIIVNLLSLYRQRRLLQGLWQKSRPHIQHFNAKYISSNYLWRPFLVVSSLLLLLLTGVAVAIHWQPVYSPQMTVSLFWDHLEFTGKRASVMVGLVAGYILMGWNQMAAR